ncbi:MAG: NAD+ synthase [Gammaproteobacteria bacterium]
MTCPAKTPGALRFALAQSNLVVGDIAGNRARIAAAAAHARDALGADVAVFPELALCGYPPEDLLFRPEFYRQIEAALAELAREITGIHVVAGLPVLRGAVRHNAAAILHDGAIRALYFKQHLPNYGVFDEKRYFTAGTDPVAVLPIHGRRVAFSVCEDLWQPGPAQQARAAGAEAIVNINASPWHLGKGAQREAVLARNLAESGLPILYLNLVGGQDELVFDGGSLAQDARGAIVYRGPHCEEDLAAVDLEPGGALRLVQGAVCTPGCEEQAVYGALVLGVRDYVRKNGFNGAVLGLSGGVDSALTLAIAVDALGADGVEAVLMPSRYTAGMSNEDAIAQAGALGVRYHIVSIETAVGAFAHTLAPVFAGLPADVTEENVQARCRGVILMAISNKRGRIVLTTGNKSEMSVGYATLYGDMAGGFAPLKDVPKMMVYRLAHWRNRGGEVIPRRVLERPPTAELRPDQKDEDSLPPYAELDPILERYIEKDEPPETIAAAGFDIDTVRRVARLVDRAEYKRRQAAPGVRVTERAFGRDRRFPITSRYDETR